jgi:hypothetical protein
VSADNAASAKLPAPRRILIASRCRKFGVKHRTRATATAAATSLLYMPQAMNVMREKQIKHAVFGEGGKNCVRFG